MDVRKASSFKSKSSLSPIPGRPQRGEALISVAIGSSILITIAFFMLDLVGAVLVNSSNDSLARNAARAAANQQDMVSAGQAAIGVVQDFHTSGIIPAVQLVKIDYLPNQKVTVVTSMNVKVPAGVPGVPPYITFQAQDTEAIVGVPSSL